MLDKPQADDILYAGQAQQIKPTLLYSLSNLKPGVNGLDETVFLLDPGNLVFLEGWATRIYSQDRRWTWVQIIIMGIFEVVLFFYWQSFSNLSSVRSRGNADLWWVLPVAGMIILPILIISSILGLRSSNYLEKHGRIVPARLLSSEGKLVKPAKGWPYLEMKFNYELYLDWPNTRTLAGNSGGNSKELLGQRQLEPGTPLAVLYADDNHYMLL